MKLYIHPKCTTCKKALAFLEERGIACEIVDIRSTPPSEQELKSVIEEKNALKAICNTSGTRYRELNLKEKLNSITKEELLALLLKDGMLIKRPFLVMSNKALAGFKLKEWEESL